jgi:hypothetical protein
MGALVSDHAVGFAGDRSVAEHGNDLEAKWDADRCCRLDDLFRVEFNRLTVHRWDFCGLILAVNQGRLFACSIRMRFTS